MMVGSSQGVAPAGHADLPQLGQILREYRKVEGLTQRDLATRLQIDQSYLSRIESGRRSVRDVEFLVQISRMLGIPANQLGISRELLHAANRRPSRVSDPRDRDDADPVRSSQEEWRSVRRYLNQHRHELANLAAKLYSPEVRIDRTPLLAPPGWIASEPVELDQVTLDLDQGQPSTPQVTGAEPETNHARPLRVAGHQYDRYTSAVRYLDPPTLFENRPSYQLLDLDLSGQTRQMRFGMATYFDKLDVAETVGHELAALHRQDPHRSRSLGALPFRSLIGDPFDATKRALLPAITTLTLRRSRTHGSATFLLHWRDPAHVATAAGIYDVIPAGEFQPSSVAWWDQTNDFDIWRNIVREYSEELLGAPEHDGSRSAPIDYVSWPLYRKLSDARAQGRVSVYYLAAAVDALTLAATILTAVVIDDDVFDEVFREAVDVNSEGLVVSGDGAAQGAGFAFDDSTVRRFVDREPMASPGAGCLELAWRHRIALLAN